MSIYTQPNMTGGIDQTLVEIVTTVPSFLIGFLLFIFGIVFLGGTTTQRKKTGYSDYPAWALMSSVAVLMTSLILSLKEGLINLEILGIVVAVTVFSGLWFFLSKGKGEI